MNKNNQLTDMRTCNVRGVFGATIGLALTLIALPADSNGAAEQGSVQAPIYAGIIVSRLTSGWSKRKDPHKDVVRPKVVVAVVVLAMFCVGGVTYRAYNVALNYPVTINGVSMSLREAMRETGATNILDFFSLLKSDPTIFRDMFTSMTTGDMSRNQAMKVLAIPVQEKDKLTRQIISKAFRKQSLRYHPDKFDGPEEEANLLQAELGKAKEVLMNLIGGRSGTTDDTEYDTEEFR